MPKMKRVVSPAKNPHLSSYDLWIDVSKSGLKNQTGLKRVVAKESNKLMEENQAKRKRLEEMKKKRSVLLAEVKFLRRRYNLMSAIQDEQVKHTEIRPPLEQPNFMSMKRKERSDKSRPAASGIKQKRQKGDKSKGFATRIPLAVSNVIQDKILKEGSNNKVASAFDLNKAWREEKELVEGKNEPLMYIGSRIVEEHLSSLKTSACRSKENGANRMDKRRISWQDPVALQV